MFPLVVVLSAQMNRIGLFSVQVKILPWDLPTARMKKGTAHGFPEGRPTAVSEEGRAGGAYRRDITKGVYVVQVTNGRDRAKARLGIFA